LGVGEREKLMSAQSTPVSVATVGLSDTDRTMIDEQCRQLEGMELSHHPAWSFGLLRAQVLVVDMDSGVGHETLNMLDSFKESASGGRPMVLRFTASEFRAAGWSRRLDAIAMSRRDQQSEFCLRLQEILAKVGARGGEAPVAAPKPVAGSLQAGADTDK
jgi:hypothetical protein